MTKSRAYVVEKTLQIIINEADLMEEEELSEPLALIIAGEIPDYEWQQVDIVVTGVR